MIRTLSILGVVLSLAACSAKTDTSATTTQGQTAGDFSVATTFSPDPPKQGSETITVTVKDSAGNPVKGGTVKISSNMPAMSMAGPNLVATDNGDGTYSAQTNLNYATQWKFDIAVAADGKSGVAHVTEDIK
ncbi:MAG: hypothetical protein NVSMB5_25890 [Candidatus Velthaea sp.]